MKRLAGTALAGLAAALALALALAPPQADASKRCGHVFIASRSVSAKVRVVRGRAGCSAARGLIRAAYRAQDTRRQDGTDPTYGIYWRVRHWRCSHGLGGSQVFCFRGGREVDGSTRRDDGWSF